MRNQARLGQFTPDRPNIWAFENYGPTSRRPVPVYETAGIPGGDGIDTRQLTGTALAPSDFELLNGKSAALAKDWGFHPDDEHRTDRIEKESQKIRELETMTTESTTDDSTDAEAAAATDGGQTTDPKPWSDYQPGDEVLLIEKPAVGLMCSPSIIEGSVSSSGKSVMVGPDEGLSSKTRRLDAETIMQGDWEFRDSTSYELYTPGRYRNTQRANHAPGPQSGANEITDAGDLPTPTHWPQGEHGEDVPEECPACGETPAHWQTKRKARPMCEACGELAPDKQDDQDDSEQDETVEKWDLSRLDRGDVLTLDGHRGEFLITRIHYFRGTKTVNRLDAATVEGGEWTTYTLSKLDSMQGRRLRVKLDDAETTPFVDVNDDSHARDFEQIRNDTELLRRYIRECYYGDDSRGVGA